MFSLNIEKYFEPPSIDISSLINICKLYEILDVNIIVNALYSFIDKVDEKEVLEQIDELSQYEEVRSQIYYLWQQHHTILYNLSNLKTMYQTQLLVEEKEEEAFELERIEAERLEEEAYQNELRQQETVTTLEERQKEDFKDTPIDLSNLLLKLPTKLEKGKETEEEKIKRKAEENEMMKLIMQQMNYGDDEDQEIEEEESIVIQSQEEPKIDIENITTLPNISYNQPSIFSTTINFNVSSDSSSLLLKLPDKIGKQKETEEEKLKRKAEEKEMMKLIMQQMDYGDEQKQSSEEDENITLIPNTIIQTEEVNIIKEYVPPILMNIDRKKHYIYN